MAIEKPIPVDLELRESFLSKSGYNPSECYQCGTCTATCPINTLTNSKLTIRNVLHKAQVGLPPDKLVWNCTSCKICETRCPREVDIVGSFRSLRNYSYKTREMPSEYETLLWNILEEANPLGEARSGRDAWMKGLDIKPAKDAEILFYVGGPSAYDPRLQRVAQTMTGIMKRFDQDIGVLGKQEPSSGEAVLETGDEAFLEQLIINNVELFNSSNVKYIVPLSPHAYNIMRNIYPKYGLEPEVMHYTEYLAKLWNDNKIQFKNKLNIDVTYHDPCYLGRYNDVYEEPRSMIEAIPGINFVEMDENKWNSLCCGGGGNKIYMDSEDGVRLSDVRVKDAAETGATNLITSCGYCIQNFEDSTKVTGTKIVTNDLIELINMALEVK